jgi:hypothetical protein
LEKVTDWQSWYKQHPGSAVALLNRTSMAYTRQFYSRADLFVLGIVSDGKARAWGFDELLKRPVLNEAPHLTK